jgi:hypothetical protein
MDQGKEPLVTASAGWLRQIPGEAEHHHGSAARRRRRRRVTAQTRSSRRRVVMTVLVCSSLLLFMALCLFWALGRQEVTSEPSGLLTRTGAGSVGAARARGDVTPPV